jgi:hypothetical protein
MQRIVLVAFLTSLLWGQTAAAQLFVSDPYARDPKSTLSQWPVIYKLPPSHKAWYYKMGFCGLAGKGIGYQAWYDRHSTFNVNALPETSWEGRIKTATAGMVEAVDDQGKRILMVINPSRKVSDVHVMGPAEPQMLKVGRWIRFVGKVDSQGRVTEPVTQLEFYTPAPTDDLPMIKADSRQLIAGCLVRRIPEGWELRPARKCKFNGVELSLASNRHMTVDVAEVSAVHEGQKVSVSGRLFDPAAQAAAQVVQAGPGYFEDPSGTLEAEQAELAAEAAAKARKGETTLVPVIFACRVVILTATDEVDAGARRATAAPSQLNLPGGQPPEE